MLQIIGSVALLLWGTRMVKNGFTRAYATSLREVIAKSTNNRFKAFLAGLGVTAVLQSSTATALIVTSFASKNMIGTAAGLAVMIGADISTTLVAQILTFDMSWLMPCFLITGAVLHHFYEHGGRRKHIARALIGLGLILLSLSQIKHSAAPLGESELLPMILKPLEKEPLMALIVAALITWLLHSSLAAVLIISSFATSGLISLHLGLLLVLGANLGGALIPFAVTIKMGAAARRITTGNMIMRISSVILILPFVAAINDFFGDIGVAGSREIVHFHTLFNIILALIFLPLVVVLAKICIKLNPETVNPADDTIRPQYLDDNALNSPTIALAGAARETLRMAEIVEEMFTESMVALRTNDMKLLEKIRADDNDVDLLNNEIKLYLTRVNEESLDPKESDRLVQILSFATNLEHVGDVIENSLLEIVRIKAESNHRFSVEGFKEIQEFHQIILKNMKIAQAIFMSEDPKLARQLVEGKKNVRMAAKESSERHFKRLKSGLPESISTSALHNDIIRDYRRVNSYITTVAYAILDNSEKHKQRRRDAKEAEKRAKLESIAQAAAAQALVEAENAIKQEDEHNDTHSGI